MAYEITQNYTVPTGIAGTYRNGKSKPEGIVIHSSGNKKASVDSEIAYMSKNYNNAFTHAWAGHDKIVEIANTDYACWGVGSIGNQRFVQIEMTEDETLSKAQHLLVIDRAAYWGAVQLDYYGLACTNAAGGSGTVWSHDAVSKYLGGTDHTDPIAYLARYSYTWNDMFNLIKKHYDALQGVKTATVAKPSTKFKKGDIVELVDTATHWVKYYNKVGGTNKGRTYIPTSLRDEQYQVTYLNSDGTIELKDLNKGTARYVAYERDLKTAGTYKVQTGAFKVKGNAEKLAEQLKKDGHDTIIVED